MNNQCSHCKRIFSSQRNYENHITKNICLNGYNNCKYCNRKFTAHNSMYRHIKYTCKIKKKQDLQKEDILERLIKLEEENKKLKQKINIIEKQKINKTVNNITNNGTIINNNITLVAYGSEDLSKLDKKEILRVLQNGYDSTLRLTETLHFNPNYPEYHNIYITNMKDKYAMIYDGKMWELTIKEELINRIYDDKKNYIEENIEDFIESLSISQKRALDRWIDTDEDNKKIKQLKERIKLLLYTSREIPLNTQKTIDDYKVLIEKIDNNMIYIDK